MAQTVEDMLDPAERVVWRDPRSWMRVFWPSFLMIGIFTAVLWGPSGNSYDVWNWSWDAFLFPTVLATGAVVTVWLTLPAARRLAQGAVTNRRVLYRSNGSRPLIVNLDLVEIASVAVAAGGTVEISRHNGDRVLLAELRRPQRFALALAEAAQASAPGLLGRLDQFSTNCWYLGGVACVIAVELMTGAGTSGGPSWGLADIAGRVLYGMTVWCAALCIGAHLTCALGLVALRPWISAGEVRAWLNTRPQGGPDSRIYRWSLWKSRPYFRLARLVWAEPMNGANAVAARHG